MRKTLWKNNRPNKIDPKEFNNNKNTQFSDLSQAVVLQALPVFF